MTDPNVEGEDPKLVSYQMKRKGNVTEIMLHGITTIITNTARCDNVFKSRLLMFQKKMKFRKPIIFFGFLKK
jgi:hypothetical protein